MGKTQIKGENVYDKSIKAIDIDISAATEKVTLVDNDSILINDSTDNNSKRVKFSNLFVYISTFINRKLLLQELSSLSDTIPAGFKGLFVKTTGIHFKDSSAVEHKIISTNNKYKSTDFEKAIVTNAILWPNCYDSTRPSIKNAILNSGDVLVNLIENGGTVTYTNGIGTIQAVHVAEQLGIIANETNRTQYLDGGSGYVVGNVLTLLSGDNNATVTVASVDGNGKVITVTLTAAGTNYKTNASCAVSGGTGTGCKIYIAVVNGSARNPAGANYINKVFQSEGQAQSSGGNLYWTSVSPTNPVEILLTMPVVTKSVHQLLLVPGGRNRHPFNYKVETTSAETTHYGGQNRWHQAIAVTTETDTYIKLINTLASEQVKYIRITIYDAGDYDYINSFALGYLIGYQRYIGDGRFTGYNMSVSGDTAYGDYKFRGTGYSTDNSKEIHILPESKRIGIGLSPLVPLDVKGKGVFGSKATSRSSFSNTLGLLNEANTDTSLFLWQYGQSSGHFGFQSGSPILKIINATNDSLMSNSSYIALTPGGSVGIGTSNPTEKLEVSGKILSSEVINFDASIEPTQTGSAITKTSTWMWQYLTQSIKWLKNNFNNYTKLNTAFTTWNNIPNNNPITHLYVINKTDISTTLNDYLTALNVSDNSPKTIILQPGEYTINANLNFKTLNIVGLSGLNKLDTIINLSSKIENIEFIENITFNLLQTTLITHWITAKNTINSYAKNLQFINTENENKFYCLKDFLNIENVVAKNIIGFAENCKKINNINIVNNINLIDTEDINLFKICSNINNIDIVYYDYSKILIQTCDNISNVKISITNSAELIILFKNCININNFNIDYSLNAFLSCININNGLITNSNNPIQNSSRISNVTIQNYLIGFLGSNRIINSEAIGNGLNSIGFSGCKKVSNCYTKDNNVGFTDCLGLNNNENSNNTQNYVNSFADLNSIYLPFDIYAGGFNA